MKQILIFMASMSILYTNMSHPVIFMVIILIQTMLICMLAWLKMSSSWFSYIMFLIFLGGLMVLFIYITSLASNEMFSFNFLLSKKTLMTLTTFSLALSMTNNEMKHETMMNKEWLFTMMYTSNLKPALLMTMSYLLFTLIVAVKITNKKDTPIKNLIK